LETQTVSRTAPSRRAGRALRRLEDQPANLSIELPRSLREALEKRAAVDDRTMSAVARQALSFYLHETASRLVRRGDEVMR
jgi:Ribbon-helix-helix protein, copG family